MFSSRENGEKYPLIAALKKQRRNQRFRFHVPSHIIEMLSNSHYEYDLTELGGLDNLFNAQNVISESQNEAALFFNADKTYYLVNGSTAGVVAAITAVCRPGDNILIGGNFHRCVVTGLIVSGASPIFAPSKYLLPEIPLNVDLKKAVSLLDEYSFRALLITAPSYWGFSPDLSSLCSEAIKRGVTVIVDEAHGGHFVFHDKFPISAALANAHIWVNSAHKTLGALTPGAFLHCRKGEIDFPRLENALAMTQSSSPSYAVMASLEMLRKDNKPWDKALEMAYYGREKLKGLIGFSLLELEKGAYGFEFDPLRITLINKGISLSGFQVGKLLSSEYGIEIEMAGVGFITAMVHRGHEKHDLDTLWGALQDIGKRYSKSNNIFDHYPASSLSIKMSLNPREANDSHWREVKLEESCGMISAKTVSAFPPGVPALIPGEVIAGDKIKAIIADLEKGYFFTGMKSNRPFLISVISE